MAENAARNIGEMLQRADLVTQIQELRQRNAMVRTARIADAAENYEDFDYNGLMGLIFTSINGQSDIKDQTVRVEFLTSAQQLRLPLGLGINLEHEDWSLVPLDATVVNRYRRAYTQSYEQIWTFIEQAGSVRAKRATFDALPLPAADFEFPNWDDRDFWTYGENGRDDAHVANTVIGLFCRLIGLNFDVRDFGFLASRRATVRVTDTQWAGEYENMNDRFINQLHPDTLSSIDGLNYAAVDQWDIGAWVRAYGVGCGVLPHEDTQLNKEWVYVRDVPDTATLNSVMAAQQRLGDKTKSFCLNILAMFGLFHLAKNHTFKKGDANMERIGITYINSLRTMVPPNIIEELKGNQEAGVCTAARPFGLAQTYWLVQALHNRLGLAVPLSLMLGVTPPPVQRLMIVDAAQKEWQNLPISRVLNDLFN
ncbi:hypothetical protein HanRHA438_Chr17g0816841 [Helianthus annuus]|nr:hypothetical protein HanHA89_Chr17g0709901 [Helianthus annuus]KAJ0632737.1 hypothetical protein HanLR1_Chr17g0668471 [Helianthus annuus]KAJ0826665.1 hypothetical protein HanRHA438_Chr17g0816841 [Helianthus annuus]